MAKLDAIKRQRIDHRLLSAHYPVELVPTVLDIPDYVEVVDVQKRTQEAVVEIEAKIQKTFSADDVPVPLTEEQAEVLDLRIKTALSNIQSMRNQLQDVRTELSNRIIAQDTESISFTFDIKKKQRLQRAIKKLWGEKLDTINFDMYKELLEAKKKLEQQEVDKFSAGKIKR